MPEPTSPPSSRAGVLELLRLFRDDVAAADQYGAICLDKARAVEPTLKAFEVLPIEVARKPGPLSGIPVAIKDIIATADMPTTNGSAIYKNHVPAADAWVVERLRNLGATIFGKTVSTEFAWRQPGPTVNPWNVAHTPGGSSSGSAAAVAAGIVPLALGSQTLGSVIRPAAFNGIVGLKPSFGAIPRTGVHPLSPSLDHVGLFARRVDDVALALSLLAGSSDSDRHGEPLPCFHVDIDHGVVPLQRPRLGVVRFEKWSQAEPEQRATFDASIQRLRDAGAVIEQTELSEFDRANWNAVNTILLSEAAVIYSDLVARYPDRTSDHLKRLVATGNALSAGDYLRAKALQERWREQLFAELPYDALVTLPAFGEAPRGLQSTGDAEYCAPWTFIGAPALTLPIAFGRNGLPLGLQIVAPYRNDHRLLCTAKWIETILAFDSGSPKIGAESHFRSD